MAKGKSNKKYFRKPLLCIGAIENEIQLAL
jgi:hypothetical protein